MNDQMDLWHFPFVKKPEREREVVKKAPNSEKDYMAAVLYFVFKCNGLAKDLVKDFYWADDDDLIDWQMIRPHLLLDGETCFPSPRLLPLPTFCLQSRRLMDFRII